MHHIGLIGTGIFATQKHMPAIERVEGLELTGCYNRTPEKAAEFASKAQQSHIKVFASIEELMESSSVDVIDALLPVEQNLSIVQRALAAGKPISIEKPIAASLKDAAEIVRLAESASVPVMVLENWCYHHGTVKLKELLPKIGAPHMFTFQVSAPFRLSQYHNTAWRQSPQHIGGFLSDAGVHDLGMITEVLGPIGSVSARSMQRRPESGTVDTLSALLNMSDGQVFGTYTQSRYSAAAESTLRFEIFGSAGSLVYERGRVTLYEGQGVDDLHKTVTTLPDDELNGVRAEFENWRGVLDGSEQLVSTPRKAYFHYAAIAAAVLSAEREGDLVHVRGLD